MRCPRCQDEQVRGATTCAVCGTALPHAPEPAADVRIDDNEDYARLRYDVELGRRDAVRRVTTPAPGQPASAPPGSSTGQSRPLSVRRTLPDVPKFRPGARDVVLPLTPQSEQAQRPDGRDAAGAGTPDRRVRPDRLLFRRITAGTVDGLLLGGINCAVVYFTLRLLHLSVDQVSQLPIGPLGCFLVLFDAAYLVGLTAFGGQTIGKITAGLRVEGRDGAAVSVMTAVARTAGCGLSVAPAGLGFIGLLLPPRRALHDWIAGTRVVRAS